MKPIFDTFPSVLLPAIVQDANTKTVLMLGYMNQEAYNKTQRENRVTFFSRSKNRLWTKGETSGNFLTVSSMCLDCDGDSLLIKANPSGPICHTGADTCFQEVNGSISFLSELEKIIWDRKKNSGEKSYTSSLLKSGINKIAQKVGEEAVELIIEAKDQNQELFVDEAADLLYHVLVLLAAKDVKLDQIVDVLQKRNAR